MQSGKHYAVSTGLKPCKVLLVRHGQYSSSSFLMLSVHTAQKKSQNGKYRKAIWMDDQHSIATSAE